MDNIKAIACLDSLAQDTRLRAFRVLVRAGAGGLPSGVLARRCEVPHNTMSTHLARLTRSGLVSDERNGRSIIYRAEVKQLQELIIYLLKDCCNGRPDVCAPLLPDLVPLAPAQSSRHA
jgi:DNA-binding transcriptional ArsR family regulator